jgi:hypothetical protein
LAENFVPTLKAPAILLNFSVKYLLSPRSGSAFCELCIGQRRDPLAAPNQPLPEGENPDLREEARDPLDAADLPLFGGENPDLRQEARDTIGEWWLKEPNIRLGGRTPEDLINENVVHGCEM